MKIKILGAAVLSCMLATGCSHTSLEVVNKVTMPLTVVSVSVENEPYSEMLEKEILGMKQIITTELGNHDIKVADKQKDTVSLVGQFGYYDSGSRFKRWLVGFSAGRAAYKSNWKLLSATGEEIGNCDISGWLAMGFFGGSLNNLHEDMADKIVDCLKVDN